jgi:dTDP-4-amino-4,6-dideoxygalactose transaminase
LANIYNEKLQGYVTVPFEGIDEFHVYQTYMIRTARRDELQVFLKSNGIETIVHYPIPIHLQPAAKYLGYEQGSFPITEKLSREILSLPLYPGLLQHEQQYVIDKIIEFHA